MKIEIIYNKTKYTIDVAPSCFTPTKHGITKKGKHIGEPTEDVLGWYNKLSNAIDAIIRNEIDESNETISLKEYVERYEKAFKELEEKIEK